MAERIEIDYPRPSLDELVERVEGDLAREVLGRQTLRRRSFLWVLARVLAGGWYLLYGFVARVAQQSTPASATGTVLRDWLDYWGLEIDPPTFASGEIVVTGVEGAEIPSETEWEGENGIAYQSTSGVVIGESGEATVEVSADEAGAEGNLSGGSKMELVQPLDGVDNEAEVSEGGITGGSDEESEEDARDRLKERIQRPPAGGTLSDYESWMREVDNVSRAWAFESSGYVMGTFLLEGNTVPEPGDVDDVQDHVDSRRPAGMDFEAYKPELKEFDFEIKIDPDTPENRDAVEEALRDLLDAEAGPDSTIMLSRVRTAVATAADWDDWRVDLPDEDLTTGGNEVHKLGEVTWL